MIGLIQTVPRMPGREAEFQYLENEKGRARRSTPFPPLSSLRLHQLVISAGTLPSGARRWSVPRRCRRKNVRRSGHWRGRRRCCGWARCAIRRKSERETPEHGKSEHDTRRIPRAMRRKRATARWAAAYPTVDATMIRAHSCPKCCHAIPSRSARSGSSRNRCCRGPQASSHSFRLATPHCSRAA